MSIEIPIWVNGKIRWLSGINKKTSCREVVQALLDEEGMNKAEAKDFAIIERWRKVERPLDEYSKILKIWSHWGNEKKEVRFCLRRIDNEVDSGRGSPIGSGHAVSLRRKRNRLRGNGKPPWAYRETLHPRRLAELGNFTNGDYEYLTKKQNKIGDSFELLEDKVESDKLYNYENIYENMHDSKTPNGRKSSGYKSYHCSGTGKLHSTPLSTSENHSKRTKCCSKREHRQKIRNSENIEKLMKLILAQGATIQSQLQKLKERDEQIESLEHERHRERIEKNGRNYLLETYLGSLKDAMAPEELEEKTPDIEDPGNKITNSKHQHLERAQHNKTEIDVNKYNKISEISRPGRDDLSNQSQQKSHRSKSESRHQECKLEGNLKRTLSDNALAEKNDNAVKEDDREESENMKEDLEDMLELKKIQSQIEEWEKVFTINKKLEKEEENLVRLHIKIKKIQTENYKFAKQSENSSDETLEEKENSEPREVTIYGNDIDRDRIEIQKSLETLRSDLENNSKEIYQNFTKLIEEDEMVQQKRSCLSKLLMDLERTDHEHNMLSQMILMREKLNFEEQQKADSNQSRTDSKVQYPNQEVSHSSPIENNVKLKMSNISVPVVSKIPHDESMSVFDSSHGIPLKVNQRPNVHVSEQNKYSFIKPKIVKIACEDKPENENFERGDDKLACKEPVTVPMGALKSILKNRQNGCNQPPANLSKEFQKSQEYPPSKDLNNVEKNANFSTGNSQDSPTLNNYSYRIPCLFYDKSPHNYGRTFHDQPPLPKVSEELKSSYSVKPFNAPGNRQTSINSFPHSTMVTTKALVHNDTDSSTSSDTSGLSSMYSSSPTVEEPYVEHSYILDTLV